MTTMRPNEGICALGFAALAAALVLCAPARSVAQDGPPEEYVEQIERAVQAGQAGDWSTARSHFRAAQRIYPNARALRGIGIAASNLGDHLEAYRALLSSQTAEVLPLSSAQRAQVDTLLEQVSEHVTVFTMDHLPDGVVVFVDGREVALQTDGTLVVAAGLHVVSVRAEHGQPRRVDADLRVPGGGREALPVEMSTREGGADVAPVPASLDPSDQPTNRPPPADETPVDEAPVDETSPSPSAAGGVDRQLPPSSELGSGRPGLVRRVVGFGSAGAGAAGLIAGAVVFARGRSAIADFDDPAPGATWRELEPLREDGERQTRVGAALMLVGGALAATGVVIALTADGARDQDGSPSGADGARRATARVRVGFGVLQTEVIW